ncbi:MAG: cell division protein ZapA [Proteobacteria bacterium]|nr:cell division protein ZapA [Pseudomonadota bacterium]
MPRPPSTVSVRILEKEYQVNCPEEEVDELTASARYLDAQMRGIRDSGKVLGLDRMAVMAALNIANDLLRLKNERATVVTTIERKVGELTQRVTTALADAKQLSL